MDNLTHSVFALTLARTPLGSVGRGATAVLVIASNAPDVDIIASSGGSLAYLEWHRGLTHGPLGVVGLGVASAVLVWLVQRQRRLEGAASLAAMSILGTVGALGHVLMDVPTSYGTRLLTPFDWHWFSTDWMPILDVYLLAILISGAVFGGLRRDWA